MEEMDRYLIFIIREIKKFISFVFDRRLYTIYESQRNSEVIKGGSRNKNLRSSWYWKYEKYACWKNDAFDREMEGMKVDEADL